MENSSYNNITFQDLIYIGANNFTCLESFNINEGGFINIDNTYIADNNDNEAILNTQNKLNSLETVFGEQYKDTYITYIPGKEMDYICNEDIKKSSSSSINQEIKEFLLVPKIKTQLKSEESNNSNKIICATSGKRSAIVKINDRYIRLKGCGNLNNGFQKGKVSHLSTIDNPHYELYGCQFKNSCLREQYVNTYLEEILKNKYDMLCGNKALGFWKYPITSDIYSKHNLENKAEMIEKYCGVFETISEKRLGEHFFSGLNKLLNWFLKDNEFLGYLFGSKNSNIKIFDIKEIVGLLPSGNFKEIEICNTNNTNTNTNNDNSENPEILGTINKKFEIFFNDYSFMNDIIASSENNFITVKKEDFYAKNKLYDINSYLQKEDINKSCNNDVKSEEFYTNYSKKEISLLKELLENEINCNKERNSTNTRYIDQNKEGICKLIDNVVNSLTKKTNNNNSKHSQNNISLISLIFKVLSQICYEIGKTKKVFELVDLNWGTYDYHSNSHLDNFLIAPPNNNKLYLAPLDFDLAFFRKQFIEDKYISKEQHKSLINKDNIDIKDKKDAIRNKIFNDLITTEKTNLLIQLTGINCIENIDVNLLNLDESINSNDRQYSSEIESLKNLILEMFHYYFGLGYNLIEDDKFFELSKYYEEGVDVIQLILLLNELDNKVY